LSNLIIVLLPPSPVLVLIFDLFVPSPPPRFNTFEGAKTPQTVGGSTRTPPTPGAASSPQTQIKGRLNAAQTRKKSKPRKRTNREKALRLLSISSFRQLQRQLALEIRPRLLRLSRSCLIFRPRFFFPLLAFLVFSFSTPSSSSRPLCLSASLPLCLVPSQPTTPSHLAQSPENLHRLRPNPLHFFASILLRTPKRPTNNARTEPLGNLTRARGGNQLCRFSLQSSGIYPAFPCFLWFIFFLSSTFFISFHFVPSRHKVSDLFVEQSPPPHRASQIAKKTALARPFFPKLVLRKYQSGGISYAITERTEHPRSP
jgi:hypothetical protein